MSDYKKSETRQILEEIYSGIHPVRGSDGREYYVRYNDDKEELEDYMLCEQCKNDCKQSFRISGLKCLKFKTF
jgi:hypothetical protein